jgi:hypothetical protein
MKNTLLRWYKSNSKIKNALALFIMTIFMIGFIDLKTIKLKRDILVRSGESDNPIKLFWDIFIWNLIFGYDGSAYTEYHFLNKSAKDRFSFVSYTEQILFSRAINLEADSNIFDKKYNTYKYFKEHYHREQITIKTKDDRKLFNEFIIRHPKFFCKPYDGASGRGTHMVDIKEKDPDKVFNELISSGAYLLEELIVQCKEMAQFNPSSINTVRTALVNTKDGIEMLFAEIRTGRKGSIVDNGGAGGILIPCDINTGKLCKYGFDNTGKKYTAHPDSNVIFENFQIPRWSEIQQLSKDLMAKVPNLKYVGWDIAIADNYLVIVEGNSRPMFGGLQGMHQTGFKKEILEILKTDKIPASFRTKQQEIFQC